MEIIDDRRKNQSKKWDRKYIENVLKRKERMYYLSLLPIWTLRTA